MFLRAFALVPLCFFLSTNIARTHNLIGGGIFNGSFESGIDPGLSINLGAPDSTTIQGWTVKSGSIDYIGSRWVAGDGNRCLDLNGLDPGTMMQTVSGLAPGQHYELSFLLAGNPEAGPTVKTLQASVGTFFQNYTFDITGATTAHLGWTSKKLDFTATSPLMDVTFTSLTAGAYGPALDSVNLTLVPEPGVWVLAGASLVLISLIRRAGRSGGGRKTIGTTR